MSPFRRTLLRRALDTGAALGRTGLAALLAATLTVTLGAATAAPAAAVENPPTPRDFTGYGFDQCLAPTQAAMDRWLNYSPFLAVGIYISGDSRGCRNQPNLTPAWIATQLRKGWRLLPITLGPQASCHPGFPRYDDDETINPRPGRSKKYYQARKQGEAEADKAVATALELGIVAGSTLWYDLEGFDIGNTDCRESALWFLSGWTWRIGQLGYVSGVYSSAGSGLNALDDARVMRPDVFHIPERIWIARWDGIPNTSTSYLRADGWLPGNRMKQYQGGHDEVWGGVRINIDRNYLDLGKGSVAAPEKHCNGTHVDYWVYDPLEPGIDKPTKVKALQCLLKERAGYAGPVDGIFGAKLTAAVNAWQEAHDQPVAAYWSRKSWMSLLADGPTPVLKVGSAGRAVRRLQRALNASDHVQLGVKGVFDAKTDAAVRLWQRKAGVDVTGVISSRQWLALQAGRR
jgi:hypothetical protein